MNDEKKKDDGGPAFPAVDGWSSSRPQGMTLRDWFAGKALQGELAAQGEYCGTYESDESVDRLVNNCYRYADAMIAARKR